MASTAQLNARTTHYSREREYGTVERREEGEKRNSTGDNTFTEGLFLQSYARRQHLSSHSHSFLFEQ
jgi:hypothetical protein